MLGEVSNPGTVLAPNHTISIPEALAAAGDILITGRKDNVQLIREENNERKFVRLDLTSKDIFTSSYYYLKQNDILYIEPNNVRKQQNNEFFANLSSINYYSAINYNNGLRACKNFSGYQIRRAQFCIYGFKGFK